MLDHLHAGVQRTIDRGVGVGMHGDVGSPVGGGLDRGAHFLDAELRGVDGVVLRLDAATGHQLDRSRALAQRFTHGAAHFVRAIGEQRVAIRERIRRAATIGMRRRQIAKVPVAAGLGDERGGGVDARAVDDTLVDRAGEPLRRAADIAHGGPAVRQHDLRRLDRQRAHVARDPRGTASFGGSGSARCVWASMMPGIRTRPPPSMTVASGRASTCSPILRISRPSTSTLRPATARSAVPSQTRTLRISTCGGGSAFGGARPSCDTAVAGKEQAGAQASHRGDQCSPHARVSRDGCRGTVNVSATIMNARRCSHAPGAQCHGTTHFRSTPRRPTPEARSHPAAGTGTVVVGLA